MVIELRFKPHGGGVWFADTFRQFAARELQEGKHQDVFWRQDGKPRPGTPEIVFVGTKSWVGLRAYTASGGRAAALAAIDLARALDRCYPGAAHHVDILEFQDGLDVDEWTLYSVRRLAIPRNKTRKHYDEWLRKGAPPEGSSKAPLDPSLHGVVTDVALAGLRERYPEAKWTVRPHGELMVGTPVTVGGELCFTVRDLSIWLPNRLRAPLQIGALRSRGFGDLRRIVGDRP